MPFSIESFLIDVFVSAVWDVSPLLVSNGCVSSLFSPSSSEDVCRGGLCV